MGRTGNIGNPGCTITVFVLLLPVLITIGCETGEYPVPYTETAMPCMDLVTPGGGPPVAVRTQASYDSLFSARVQKPLDDYWKANYDSTLSYLKRNHPGLSDSEYAVRVRQIFYSLGPFRGTESCTDPVVDFSRQYLLGLATQAAGCSADYTVAVLKDDDRREILYHVTVLAHGTCEMLIVRNKWVIVPRFPDTYRVVFKVDYIRG